MENKNKYNKGDFVLIPETYILGNGRKEGIVEEVYYDDFNEIYKYKIKIKLPQNQYQIFSFKLKYNCCQYYEEWFMEEELSKLSRNKK
jgi:hypothetical protein